MFKRPAWATGSSGGTLPSSRPSSASGSFTLPNSTSQKNDVPAHEKASDDSDSLFRHATRTHDAVVAGLAARQRKEVTQEKKGRRSRTGRKSGEKRESSPDKKDDNNDEDRNTRDKSSTPIKDEPAGQGSSRTPTRLKKRRINANDVNDLLSRAGIKPIALDDDDTDEAEADLRNRPDSLERTYSQDRPVTAERQEDEDEVQIQSVRPTPKPVYPPNEDDDSDPELAELRRKARERHKQTEERLPTPGPGTTHTPGSNPATDPDPIMQILITSPIPNTNPLIVQRRLSQRLKEVRLGWCQKQGFAEDVTATVFLTFRGRRKYDVTAVKSLGLAVDALGTVTMRNGDFWEEADRIHLEAVTEEILAQRKAEETQQQQLEAEAGEPMAVREMDGEAPLPPPQLIRLVIKAKGQKDFKLRVKPETVISKIVSAARREFNAPAGGATYLEFDGERLDPQAQVKDTEIEDMMCLDFYAS